MVRSRPFHSGQSGPVRTLGVRICLLLLGSLLLSGCITVEFGSTFEENGSATHTLEIVFPRENLEQDEFARALANLNRLIAEAEAAGLAVERVERDNETLVRVTNTVEDSAETGAALNSLINAAGVNTAPGINAPFKGTYRQEVEAVGGAVYILDMVIEGNELFESLATLETGEPAAVPRESLRQTVTIEYVATMPGQIVETTGEQLSDDTIRWDLALEGQQEIYARSKSRESGSTLLFVATGIGALLAVVIVTIVIEAILMRRRHLSSRLSTAAVHLPQHSIATRYGHWLIRNIERIFHRPRRQGVPSERLEAREEGK